MKKRKGYPVYPVSAAQKFHFFYLDHCPNKAVVNIGVSLTIEAELDFELLREMIFEAYRRSESMRVQFAQDKDGSWYQYVVDEVDQEVPFVDRSEEHTSELQSP